jgi:phage terminase large subunit-like protein
VASKRTKKETQPNVLPHVADALRYADDVLSSKIPACEALVSACKRFKRDLRRSSSEFRYRFDHARAEHALEAVQMFSHTKGKWAANRELLILEPWQKFFIANIFGWIDRKTKYRRFREAFLFVARKNGKSLLAAAIGNYMLTLDDEHGAEVLCGATSEEQAFKVFEPARMMLLNDEELAQELGVTVYAKSIVQKSTASTFKPLIGKPGDGASPSCSIIDEYHEHTNSDQYDAMVTGMGARSQPLLVVITTAGASIGTPCFDKYTECRRILSGVIEDDTVFALVYELDEGDQPLTMSLDQLRKANPNLGVSVNEEYLASRQRAAVVNPINEAAYETKNCNRWRNVKSCIFNLNDIERAGKHPSVSIEELAGEDCFIAVDMAQKTDLCASMIVFRVPDDQDGIKYYGFGKYYLPEQTIEDDTTNRNMYQAWAKSGRLIVTSGAIIDKELIIRDLLDDIETYNPIEFVYDPFNASDIAKRIADETHCNTVEFTQSLVNMAAATDEFVALLRDDSFRHQNDRVLVWCASNCVGKTGKKGLMVPVKQRRAEKIDAAIAAIMATARAVGTSEHYGGSGEVLSV